MATIQISPTLASNTNFVISGLDVFRAGSAEVRISIKPLYLIDGIPLSEHNRATSDDLSFNAITVDRWNSKMGVYFKTQYAKNSFKFSWRFLPGKRENTVDLNEGRNFIKSFATDQLSHTLSIRNLDSNGTTAYTTTNYTVLVVEYNESLIRRDLLSDEYYWDCNLTLQEV